MKLNEWNKHMTEEQGKRALELADAMKFRPRKRYYEENKASEKALKEIQKSEVSLDSVRKHLNEYLKKDNEVRETKSTRKAIEAESHLMTAKILRIMCDYDYIKRKKDNEEEVKELLGRYGTSYREYLKYDYEKEGC